jgi:hypothetical protein
MATIVRSTLIQRLTRKEFDLAFEVVVPRHRWSRASLLFDRWLLDDGDWVKNGNSVCTLDVNGVSLPVTAEHDGFLTIKSRDLVAGKELQPGLVIGYVTRPSESVPLDPEPAETIRLPKRRPVEPNSVHLQTEWNAPVKKRAASPRARRAARDANIPLRAVRGTGYRGRIVLRDVHAAAPAIAATGGAVVPAWHATDIQVKATNPEYIAYCHHYASELLKRIVTEDLSLCDNWDSDKLILTLPRVEEGLATYCRFEAKSPFGKRVAEDELENNLVPVFLSEGSESQLLIPPLPPGALFSIGFSAITKRPIVAKTKVTIGEIVTLTIAFDSQRLAPQTIERWLSP